MSKQSQGICTVQCKRTVKINGLYKTQIVTAKVELHADLAALADRLGKAAIASRARGNKGKATMAFGALEARVIGELTITTQE